MSLSWARNSRLVNNTSTMPVQLTKLVMSASVTVRPIVLNCRPTGRSSKQNPSPTVSILSPSDGSNPPTVIPAEEGVIQSRGKLKFALHREELFPCCYIILLVGVGGSR